MRNRIPHLVSICATFLLLGGSSFADSLLEEFDLDTGLNPIASQGEVSLTLNGDGTIAASVVSFFDVFVGIGFNSATSNLFETDFSPPLDPSTDNPDGWIDTFGYQPSGFYFAAGTASMTWTIGNPGDYTSVFQVLDGGNQSTVQFYMLTGGGNEFGALLVPSLPEPSSCMLLGLGGAGLILNARRRRHLV